MSRRFTLADLLFWMALIGLVLAIVVPVCRHVTRVRYYSDEVIDVAASADGTTFAALLGDGRVLIWDKEGILKATLPTLGTYGGWLALSFDGQLAAVTPAGANEYVNVYPRGTVEILDIAKRKVKRALPQRAAYPRFSTSDNRLLMQFGKGSPPYIQYEIYSADLDDRPRIVPERKGTCAAFSPDGTRIALGTQSEIVQIWRLNDLSRERELSASGSADIARVAFSPDGQSMAALVLRNGESYVIETWDLSTGVARPGTPDVSFGELQYSPDGRRIFFTPARPAFGGDGSATKVFDAQTLEPAPAPILSEASMIAAGMRGDTFVTANQYSVDLCDTATLRPTRRLFEGPPPPNVWPAVGCLVIWLVVFILRAARKRARQVGLLLAGASGVCDRATRC